MERKIIEIAQKTWLISDYYLANMYLLEGEEKALLIDTGSGLGPLEDQIRSLTQKPLEIVLTHGDDDHIGGCHLFPDVVSRLHPADMYMTEAFDREHAEAFVKEYIRTRGPVRNPDASAEEWEEVIRPYGKARFAALEDGEKIDLGGRMVEVIHTPGHSRGSVCFLDHGQRLLITGDTANDCLLLNYPPRTSTVEEYQASIRKLWDRRDEYDGICQGHDALSVSDVSFLSDYLKAAEMILSGESKAEQLDDGIHQGAGVLYGKIRLFYDVEQLR